MLAGDREEVGLLTQTGSGRKGPFLEGSRDYKS